MSLVGLQLRRLLVACAMVFACLPCLADIELPAFMAELDSTAKPLRYADGRRGAELRRALDPRRATSIVESYLQERRNGGFQGLFQLREILDRYQGAFIKWPGEFEDEYLDGIAWRVALHGQGLWVNGLPLRYLESYETETFIRRQVDRRLFSTSGARRATQLANQLQKSSLHAFPEQLGSRPFASGAAAYTAGCAQCHSVPPFAALYVGGPSAPPLGDRTAWERYIRGKSIEEVVTAAASKPRIRGRPDMHGHRSLTEIEYFRAVVHLVNAAGRNFQEPAKPQGHSGLVTVMKSQDSVKEKDKLTRCDSCHQGRGPLFPLTD